MSAEFRRKIHQQAQVSLLETFNSNLESQTIVMLSNILNYSSYFQGFHQIITGKYSRCPTLTNKAASEPHLPRVARCIPVTIIALNRKACNPCFNAFWFISL